MTASNRDLIEAELDARLTDLSARHAAIRSADAELRGVREAAEGVRLTARNLRMAIFALDGDTDKTVADADAANEEHMSGLED